MGTTLQALRSQVDTVCEENTKRDEQLIGTDHGTTDVLRGTLSLVHGHNQGASANTKTSSPTAHDNLDPVTGGGRDLNNDSDHEDNTPDSDGPFPAQLISERSTTESTNKRSDRQKTDNQTGPDVAEGI